MSPLLGINLIPTNENFAIKSFPDQVREISFMTVELPTPQNTDYTNYGFDIKSKIFISLFKRSLMSHYWGRKSM